MTQAKQRLRFIAFMLSAFAAGPTAAQQPRACGERLLASVEPDGGVSAGSLDAVLRRVLSGDEIRVGWEVGRSGEPPIVVHWQDASFLTLFEGHVFAQLNGVRQTPRIGESRIDLSAADERWASLLSTDGRLLTRVPGRAEASNQRVRSHWCLKSNP